MSAMKTPADGLKSTHKAVKVSNARFSWLSKMLECAMWKSMAIAQSDAKILNCKMPVDGSTGMAWIVSSDGEREGTFFLRTFVITRYFRDQRLKSIPATGFRMKSGKIVL